MYAIIAGGGKVGFFLARELIEQGHEVLIIEQNTERAEFIANELGNVVLRGKGGDQIQPSLHEAERADVIIAAVRDTGIAPWERNSSWKRRSDQDAPFRRCIAARRSRMACVPSQ